LSFRRQLDSIASEAALDSPNIIRMSLAATQMDAADCLRNYKSPASVECAFRSLKTIYLSRFFPFSETTSNT
jgi:hypothetical protein